MGLAKTLSDFFSQTIKTLRIPKFHQSDPVSAKVNDPTIKAILKYRKNSSILTIKAKCKRNLPVFLSHITQDCIHKGVRNLDTSKASQDIDILTKMIKGNLHIFHLSFLKL